LIGGPSAKWTLKVQVSGLLPTVIPATTQEKAQENGDQKEIR
jgi:hypothetical protein